jgi:hypothetical protein
MRAAHKILASAVLLALGAGGLCLLRGRQRPIPAQSARATPPALPAIALGKEDAARVSKLELTSPDLKVTMEKRGTGWELIAPIATEASSAKIVEAIQNLETLHLWKQLDPGTSYYGQYDLTEDKALHIVAWKGADKVVDLFCGKGSSDGQLVRLPDRDGMFALVNWGPQGYAGFLFTGDLRSWRETSIFNFAPEDVVGLEITNPKGGIAFAKSDGRWLATRQKPKPDGQLGRATPWPRFDATKIETLLRDYRALAAEDFGDGVTPAEAGIDDAERSGGVIRIRLKGGAALTLRVGKIANNRTRWAIKDGRWAARDGGHGTLYAIAPWPAAWAIADAHKFE